MSTTTVALDVYVALIKSATGSKLEEYKSARESVAFLDYINIVSKHNRRRALSHVTANWFRVVARGPTGP